MLLNWSSGVLVGVGGSDSIGYEGGAAEGGAAKGGAAEKEIP